MDRIALRKIVIGRGAFIGGDDVGASFSVRANVALGEPKRGNILIMFAVFTRTSLSTSFVLVFFQYLALRCCGLCGLVASFFAIEEQCTGAVLLPFAVRCYPCTRLTAFFPILFIAA